MRDIGSPGFDLGLPLTEGLVQHRTTYCVYFLQVFPQRVIFFWASRLVMHVSTSHPRCPSTLAHPSGNISDIQIRGQEHPVIECSTSLLYSVSAPISHTRGVLISHPSSRLHNQSHPVSAKQSSRVALTSGRQSRHSGVVLGYGNSFYCTFPCFLHQGQGVAVFYQRLVVKGLGQPQCARVEE